MAVAIGAEIPIGGMPPPGTIAIGYGVGVGATAGWGGMMGPIDDSVFIGDGAGAPNGMPPNMHNVVVGARSDANGSYNIIFGCNNKVTGNNNYVVGNNIEITGNKICFIQNVIVPQYRNSLVRYFCKEMEDMIMEFVW
jgi:hypothetical protein